LGADSPFTSVGITVSHRVSPLITVHQQE